jgi:hypothetical protein
VRRAARDHDRAAFSCGAEPLGRYLKQQASQQHHRHVAKCFVAIQTAEETLGGFYTLSASSILFAYLPAGIAKRLPRYPQGPAALLGRLAVDRGHQARGWLSSSFRCDAPRPSRRHRGQGFLEICPGHKRLYLPVGTIAKIFA